MDVSRRRVGVRGSVVAGSVWESRMKSDQVRGGVKVFNGGADENAEENAVGITRLKRSQAGVAVPTGKRKTWRSESTEGLEKSTIQIARGKTEPQKGEQCKEISVSPSDGVKKSPIQVRKVMRSEGSKEVGGGSAEKAARSPIHTTRKVRSEAEEQNGASECGESGDGVEKNIGKLRKSKSDSIKTENQSVKGVSDGNGGSSIQLRKTKSESDHALVEPRNEIDGSENRNVLIENGEKDGADEDCKDFGVCQEKVMSNSSDNVEEVKCTPELSVNANGDSDDVDDDEGGEEEELEEEGVDEEIDVEMEKSSFDVKEISVAESKVVNEPENKVVVNEPENKVVVNEPENKVVVNEPEKKVTVKEPEKKVAVKEPEKHKIVNEPEPKKVVSANRRFHQRNEKPVSVPLNVKQSPPNRRHSTIYQNFSKANSIPRTEPYSSFPQTQSKLQSLVDLIMWRDMSRSAFIFGIGTFIIVSSSYAKDINLSLISVTSYMGLVYLAVIFLYRSLVCRGVIDVDDTNYVLGEEEAIWVLKLILPYLNEFLSRLRAMFSGDPGTTMKLAALLFVLARCGNSITIWKMAKFGFFGVFTVPKFCSLYSAQLTAYANFWIRRFRDAWDSCSHKKAVALGIFGLVWNLSSVVARIWAVFVLFVAFRYYQQHYLGREDWVEDEAACDETWQEPVVVGVQRQGRAPNFVETHNKVKKAF